MGYIFTLFVFGCYVHVINNIITNQGCNYNETLCPFKSEIEIIQYYSKGINYSSLNMTYDIMFLKCVNKFYQCGYMFSNEEALDYMNSGVRIGLGIDLSEYNETYWQEVNMPDIALEKVKPFFGVKGKDAENVLLNNNIELDYDIVYEISIKHIDILLNYTKTVLVKENLNDPFITTPLLSLMLFTNITNTKIYDVIKSGNIEYISYLISNLLTNMTSIKQAQSFAITAKDTQCYKNTLVSFIIDTSMNATEFNITFSEEISTIIKVLPYEVSLITCGETAEEIFSFTRDITYMNESIHKINYTQTESMDIENAINEAEQRFDNYLEDITYYVTKIIILVINNKANENEEKLEKIINEYVNKGYRFIIIGNNKNENYYENILNTKNNIFYVKGFDKNNQDNTILPNIICTSICRQHINLQLNKKISNLEIVSISGPHYFEINLSKKQSKKYIIELDIKNIQTSDYQIYISTKVPYPNINEYDIKHLGNINDLSQTKSIQPYLILFTEDIDKIFISIESEYLQYSISIKECKDDISKCKVSNNTSNGLFGTKEINITLGPSSEYLSFDNCYEKKCTISNETLIKFIARGLAFYNTNDNRNEDETFLNSYIFNCLYSLYYCAYIDKEKRALIGYPKSIIISEIDPLKLLSEYSFPKLLINKIRPLIIKDKNSYDIALKEENIYFTNEETFILYNVSFTHEILSMNRSLLDCKNCFNVFNQLDVNWRFILFMNKLSNENDFYDSLSDISNMNITSYLHWLFNNNNGNSIKNETLYKHIQNVILQSIVNDKKETCLISLIVGDKLAYTSNFAGFFKEFIEYLPEQKISLTLFDEKSTKLKQLFDFSRASNELIDKLDAYTNIPKKFPNTLPTIDVDDVINHEISRFDTYDKGIKRVILIIGDEHFQSDNGYINHELKIKNHNKFKKTKKTLSNKHINIMLITSIPPNLKYHNYINEYLNDFNLEEIFPISNFSHIMNAYQNIANAIRQINVKIPNNYIIINDYFKFNFYYYEIDIQSSSTERLVLQFSSNHINVYYSFEYPYPNKYINNGNCYENQKCEIDIPNNTKLYITLQPTKDLIYLKAQICEWDTKNNKCKNIKEIPFITMIILLASTLILFIYGLVTCKTKDQRSTKKTNIFT